MIIDTDMHRTVRRPPYLSIIIPAFNEAGRIRPTLEQIARYLGTREFSSEIVVVDDGSTDTTAEVAGSAQVGQIPVEIVRHERNTGKGYAVQQGAFRSRGDAILICDADLSVPIEKLSSLLDRMRDGFDLVIASRRLRAPQKSGQPLHRAVLGTVFSIAVRALLVEGITDSQCGFKLISRKAADVIFPQQRIRRFAFDVELLVLARQSGFAIAEVPVTWRHVGQSHVRPFRDGLGMVIDLLRIRWHWRTRRSGGR